MRHAHVRQAGPTDRFRFSDNGKHAPRVLAASRARTNRDESIPSRPGRIFACFADDVIFIVEYAAAIKHSGIPRAHTRGEPMLQIRWSNLYSAELDCALAHTRTHSRSLEADECAESRELN